MEDQYPGIWVGQLVMVATGVVAAVGLLWRFLFESPERKAARLEEERSASKMGVKARMEYNRRLDSQRQQRP